MRRPKLNYELLRQIPKLSPGAEDPLVAEQVEIQIKYAGYIERQQMEIEKARSHEETDLPEALDYTEINGLSNEVRQKLVDIRPETIGQAARISGVTPAAVSLLLVHLKKKGFPLRKTA
jgi:tRNA uridine 5-carboxymethylaminomethyl modification enzyme